MTTRIHNFERNFKRIVERIENPESVVKNKNAPKYKISQTNKNALLEFKDYLISEGIGYAKITKYLQELIVIDNLFCRPFEQATEQNIRQVVSKINQSNYSESTKRDYRLVLRKFYCFLRKTDKGIYPPEVKWISLKIEKNHKKLPEELLTEEEIKKIIQGCDKLRDKALIAVLAESGARISEIGNMKIKHVSFEEIGARLSIEGKTGARKVLVVWSSPYLQEWINQHPSNSNPESYLWYNPQGELLEYVSIAAMLKRAVNKAGIKKRVYPHLFRHSQATHMANIMTESAMKEYFGWTQNSGMAGIYVHMSGKVTDEAILRANGLAINKEIKKPALEPIKCLKCKTINEATNRFCKLCGLPLSKEEAERILQEDTKRTQADEIMNKLVSDKDILELIKKKLKS